MLTQLLEEMNTLGLRVNIGALSEGLKKTEARITSLETALKPFVPSKFSVNSARDVKEYFSKKNIVSTRPIYSFNADILTFIERQGFAEAGIMLELRKAIFLRSRMIRLQEDLGDMDYVFPNYNTVASSGRICCEDPNVVGFPLAMREFFIPDEDDMVFIYPDYKSNELMIIANLAYCKSLVNDIVRGRDVFDEIGQATGLDRGRSKELVYARAYGQKLDWAAWVHGVTEDKVYRVYNEFDKMYPEISKYIASVENDAAQEGYTETEITHRKCIIDFSAQDVSKEIRRAVNHVVQGTAADIMEEVLGCNSLLDMNGRVCIPIYDGILLQTKEYFADGVQKHVENIMVEIPLKYGIVLTVKSRRGKNWLEASGGLK